MPSVARNSFWLAWLTAAVFGVLLLGIIAARIHGRLGYDPRLVELLAPIPAETTAGLNLHDGRIVRQIFPGAEGVISHIGIGVANLRGASDDAVVTVRLADGSKLLGTAQSTLADFRTHEPTWLPMPAVLREGQNYELAIQTSGVAEAQAVTLFFEKAADKVPGGAAAVRTAESNTWTELAGNVGVTAMQFPTMWVVGMEMLRSAATWALVSYAGLLALLLLKPWRRKATELVTEAITLPYAARITWRELTFVTLLGLMLALTITLPYYTGLDQATTMGDVQRALVYRGVARDALFTGQGVGQWDPYLCGGEPLLANAESAHLDPFFLLVVLFGENLGARLSVTATLALGFVGAYGLARRVLGAQKLPALLAGGIFAFSGFQMLAFANGNYAWIPVGFIPWVIWLYLESWQKTWAIFLSALAAAFIFLGGSVHMAVYASLAIAIIGLLGALATRSWKPLVLLVIYGMAAANFSAVKLLPVAELQAISSDFDRVPGFLPPLSWIPKMFWDRGQLATPQWTFAETGENFRWIEYGAYVGVVPAVLFIIGLAAYWRRKIWLVWAIAAAVVFPVIYGLFPWTILNQLPLLDEVLRNPQRARVIFLLLAGGLAAVSLQWWAKRLPLRWRKVVVAAVVGAVLVDMVVLHAPLYRNLFNLEPPQLERQEAFHRVESSYTEGDGDVYYKLGYANYLANQGTTDLCIPYLVQRGVHAVGVDNSNPATPYRGEAYLASDNGEARLRSVTGGHLEVDVQPVGEDWLVINQNFFPGWRTSPSREVQNRNGLLAVRVQPTDTHLTLTYQPWSYQLGLLLTVTALVLVAGVFHRLTRAPAAQ